MNKKLLKRIEELEKEIKELKLKETVIVVPIQPFQMPTEPQPYWAPLISCEGISY